MGERDPFDREAMTVQHTYETPVPIGLLTQATIGPVTAVPVRDRRLPVWAVLQPDIQPRTGGRR